VATTSSSTGSTAAKGASGRRATGSTKATTGSAGSAGSADEQARPLVLLDGHSIAYRAFFALPSDLATTTGQQTNAVYGFTSMLVKLFGEVAAARPTATRSTPNTRRTGAPPPTSSHRRCH
jgi:5'-3' exonuclease-like protein